MRILKVRDVKTPTRGTNMSAGIDLYIPEDFYIKKGDKLHKVSSFDSGAGQSFKIQSGSSVLIPSGIKANVPKDRALIAFNKSGVAVKKNLMVGACIIDEDYTGEIHIDVKNVGTEPVLISAGDKIIQLVCMPVDYVNIELCDSELDCFGDTLVLSERGAGGFGSTGVK
jgi:dUTP pyrophosphatase